MWDIRSCVVILFLTFFEYIIMSSTKCLFYLPTEIYVATNQNWTLTDGCEFVYINDSSIFAYNDIYNTINTNSKKNIQVSLVNPLLSHQLHSIAQSKGEWFWSIDKSHCQLDDFFSDDVTACNRNYAKAIIELSKLFHADHAAIITSSNICHQSTATEIMESLALHSNTASLGIRDIILYRTKNVLASDNLREIFYDMKSRDVSVIILLVDKAAASLIFEMAKRYGMASYETVWLSVEYGNFLTLQEDDDDVPWQIIDFQQSRSTKWKNELFTEIISVVNSFINEHNITKKSHDSWEREKLTLALKQKLYEMNCIDSNQNIDVYVRNISQMATLTWTKVFTWNSNQQLKMYSEASLLVRMIRTPARTITLKIVTIIDPPFTMIAGHLYNDGKCDHGVLCRQAVEGLSESDAGKWESTCCIGLIMDLLSLVASDLHFLPDVYIVEDGYYGGHNKTTNTWNGLVQDIYKEKADIAMAALTPTSDRSKVVDFCEPYMRIDIVVLISTLNNSLRDFINWEFLSPLTHDLRVWILCTFIIGTILIYILENQHLVLKRITDKSVHARYPWREGFTYFSGLTFQRDLGGKNPQRSGARVTAVSFAFGMVIIMTTYTAVLTASKVSQESTNPFLGFKDDRIRYPTSEFKYATVAHTSIESYFKNYKDEFHQRMYQFMLSYNVNQTTEGIELVQAGRLQAFIHEYPLLSYHMSKQNECNLKIYGDPIPQGGYAFSVPKNSPWTHLLSQSILKYKEKEIINEIYNKWFPSACTANSTTTTTYSGVELNYFGGLIFILALCLVLTVVLLAAERFCHRHHRRVINPIQDKVLIWKESKAAGRRNALINPEDIDKLQKLQKKVVTDNESDSSSEGSVMSEGEEELMRMRMANKRRMSRTVTMSDTTEIISASTESLDSETVMVFRNRRTVFSGTITGKSVSTLHTTIEVNESDEDTDENEDKDNGDNEDNRDDRDGDGDGDGDNQSCALGEKLEDEATPDNELTLLNSEESKSDSDMDEPLPNTLVHGSKSTIRNSELSVNEDNSSSCNDECKNKFDEHVACVEIRQLSPCETKIQLGEPDVTDSVEEKQNVNKNTRETKYYNTSKLSIIDDSNSYNIEEIEKVLENNNTDSSIEEEKNKHDNCALQANICKTTLVEQPIELDCSDEYV